ncbi:hypothetical protein BN1088_1433392 [Sphingobacterium sp. PM2-P1-29]|nr:hypothetical protein BN1088_1433392 [Sphingobacterium sp. PM2-P1-29]
MLLSEPDRSVHAVAAHKVISGSTIFIDDKILSFLRVFSILMEFLFEINYMFKNNYISL